MKKLTRKQSKLVTARLRDPEATHREIGLQTGTIRSNVTRELNKPHVKLRIRELMDSRPKLRLPALLKRLEEGLESKKTQYFADKGNVVDERTDNDMSTRKGYLELAVELQGAKEKTVETQVNNFFGADAYREFMQAFREKSGG